MKKLMKTEDGYSLSSYYELRCGCGLCGCSVCWCSGQAAGALAVKTHGTNQSGVEGGYRNTLG